MLGYTASQIRRGSSTEVTGLSPVGQGCHPQRNGCHADGGRCYIFQRGSSSSVTKQNINQAGFVESKLSWVWFKPGSSTGRLTGNPYETTSDIRPIDSMFGISNQDHYNPDSTYAHNGA